jgi:phosphoribosylformylglycinamidine synthase
MPIAHKQGNFIADEETLNQIEGEGQVAFRYTDSEDGNPNGSMNRIAGILNNDKNVLGMMPHPERAAESLLGSQDGLQIFTSILGTA